MTADPRDGLRPPAPERPLDPGVEALSRLAREAAALEERRPLAPFPADRPRPASAWAARVRAGLLATCLGAAVVALVMAARLAPAPAPRPASVAPRPAAGGPAPLTYAFEGGAAPAAGEEGPGAGGPRLRFSDGTAIRLAARAALRVLETRPGGATVRLDDGAVSLHVARRPGASWVLQAGPFEVRVTGTIFDVHWSAAREAFDVTLAEGGVAVRGPLTDVTLRPGERLSVRLRDRRSWVGPIGPASPVPATPPPAGAAAAASPAPPLGAASDPRAARPGPREGVAAPPTAIAARRAPGGLPRGDAPAPPEAPRAAPPGEPPAGPGAGPTGGLAPPPLPAPAIPAGIGAAREAVAGPAAPGPQGRCASGAWPGEIAAGRFAAVLSDAARDPEACLREASPEALLALADAARYERRPALGRAALLALRARSGASEAGRESAFFLGRLAEDVEGAHEEALRWYARSRAERPDGPYAAEAAGRALVLRRTLGDERGARAAAEAYLREFPRGPYAAVARALLAEGR